MNTETPNPGPRPGPAGPDPDELRSTFEDLLDQSASSAAVNDHDDDAPVTDQQVEALDAAHELLGRALTALDSTR